MTRRTPLRIALLLLLLLGLLVSASAADKKATERNFTFLSTSDSHFAAVKNEDRNTRDIDTIRAMNALTDICWPEQLGGDRIQTPKGVILLGDVIDDGDMKTGDINISQLQYAKFLECFGLDGKDGLLRYPVFEGWGNHDGPPVGAEKNFSSQTSLKARNEQRKAKGLISNLSENKLHYSWDWDDVHFVQLGIYPADKQREGVRYSPVWHNPQNALSFLKQDLEKNVGTSGRPVILMAHMGMDTDWWVMADWVDFYNAIKKYNVVAYIYGHSGTGVRQWAPAGETKQLLCINDGQTENGFFTIQLKGDTMRFGYRVKNWSEGKKLADGKPGPRIWDGQWKWDWTTKVDLKKPNAPLKLQR